MILAVSLALVVQPQKQLNKAWDSTRLSDITKIRTAADAFYDDKNCYPDPSSIPFGSQWKDQSTGTVYMTKVPQDPEHGKDPTKSYLYQTDGTECPQWNVIYGRLTYSANKSTTTCPLEQMGNCLPPGYANSSYNYCVVSGTVNCSYISSTVLAGLPTNIPTPTPPQSTPTPSPSVGPTPTPSSGPTPTPSPTPTPTPPPGCNPPNNALCNNICVDTRTDFNHCGICGNSCSSGQLCVNSTCQNCSKDYICSVGRCNIVPAGTGTYCTSNCDGFCQ